MHVQPTDISVYTKFISHKPVHYNRSVVRTLVNRTIEQSFMDIYGESLKYNSIFVTRFLTKSPENSTSHAYFEKKICPQTLLTIDPYYP